MNKMFACRCPFCRSVDFRCVGVRNALERALLWLVVPQRCGLCGRHFFLLRWVAPIGDAA
jgi:hypothetical protein